MAIISRLAVLLGLDAGEFNAGLGQAKSKVEGFSLGAKASLASIGISFALTAKTALDFADKVADVAKANDMSIQSVLRMSEALTVNGGRAEDAGKLMASFNNKIDEAAQGGDKAQKAFQRIGISINDLKHLSPEKLWEKTIQQLASVEDSTKRNAMAMDIFGRAIKGVDIKGFADQLQQNKDAYADAEEAFKKINQGFDNLSVLSQRIKTDTAKDIGDFFELVTRKALESYDAISKVIAAQKELASNSRITPATSTSLQGFIGTIGLTILDQQVKKVKELKNGIASLTYKPIDTTIGPDFKTGKNTHDRDIALSTEIQKQNEALQQQILTFENEAKSVGKVQSAQDKLNIEFQKGGKFVDASAKLKKKATEDAIALDKARQAFELNKMLRESAYDEKKMETIREFRFASEAEKQYQMDILDLEKRINDQKESGLLVDKEAEKIYREQEMKRIERKKKIEEEQHTFGEGWKKAYEEYVRDAEDAAKNAQELFGTMAHGMEDMIATFIRTGKLDFKSFANVVLDEIARIEARLIASKIFKFLKTGSFFGGDSMGDGGASGALSSLFTTAPSLGGLKLFADGGSPPMGVPSIVGERGPELFVPRTSGTIIPNNQLGSAMGGSPQVVYNGPVVQNMSAIDTQSAVQFLAKNKQAVWSANQSAQRSLPQSR